MTTKDIKFLEIRYLRGPNIWTYRPVIEAIVDIGELEDFPSNTLPGFVDRLKGFLPSLIEHRCSYGERGGFLRRLEEGTWPGHILEHVSLELQNLAGMPGGFGKARQTSLRGVYKVVIRAWHEEVTRACLEAGRELVMAAIEDTPFAVAATVERLRDMAERKLLGPSTGCIVEAATAKARRIPAIRMLADGNLVQLGYGARSRRIWTAETDRTSAIAETISRDKDLTKELISSCGVPVPEGRLVESPKEAWDAAEDIGLPVVVKPTDGNHGRGVFTDLKTREEVEAAYLKADEEGSGVMVERFIRGAEHRLLVIGGKLVAANKGDTAYVTGDGKSTIRELIDLQINSDPRRGEEEHFPLTPILLEREPIAMHELQRQGFTPESVPANEQEVLVIRHGNMAFDVTDEVHKEVAAAGVLAAQIVGLDIAGIDLVTEDISKPFSETQGAIVEVNAGPSLLMHLKPAVGKPRPAGQAIVDHLFPPGESGRIPVVGVLGRREQTLIARLVARLLHLSGKHVGLACGDGLFLDQRQLDTRSNVHFDGGERLLINRSIDAAVCETSARAILAEGLPYDRCQVAVLTDVSGQEEIAEFYIDSEERLYNVLRTQIDVVLPEGVAVLNAADPKVVEMASLCDGAIIYYALSPDEPPLAAHLASGGRAVCVREGRIMLCTGSIEEGLSKLSRFALTAADAPAAQVEAVLAAIAASWALEVPTDLIPAGIEHFEQEQAGALAARTGTRKNG